MKDNNFENNVKMFKYIKDEGIVLKKMFNS